MKRLIGLSLCLGLWLATTAARAEDPATAGQEDGCQCGGSKRAQIASDTHRFVREVAALSANLSSHADAFRIDRQLESELALAEERCRQRDLSSLPVLSPEGQEWHDACERLARSAAAYRMTRSAMEQK